MAKRPNILWFTSDQQRWDTIHALGNTQIDTPNLDRLVQKGVSFTNTYCQNPICTPSRASFLTGRYPSSINANMNGAVNTPEHCELISKRLSDAGYYCGLAGKLHIASAWNDYEDRMDDGFQYFQYNLGSGHFLNSDHNPYKDWLTKKGIDWHDIFESDEKHDYHWYRTDAPIEFRQTAWLAEEAVHFMNEHKDDEQPWMLSINCFDPHPPYDAPKVLVDKYLKRMLPEPIFSQADMDADAKLKEFFFQSAAHAPNEELRKKIASYYGMVEIVDTHLGKILNALDELHLTENTLVIYNSDHGEMLGDHGYTHKGCRFYEGLVHVPLIMSLPGTFQENTICNDITELTDIVPTILDLCGLELTNVHGRTLLPVLSGGTLKPRKFVRTEYYDTLEFDPSYDGLRTEAEISSFDEELPTSYADMYFDGRYKLNVYHGSYFGELFDLKEDPKEQHNLWDDPSYQNLKCKLLLDSYEASVKYSRPGQERRGRF